MGGSTAAAAGAAIAGTGGAGIVTGIIEGVTEQEQA